ncbi:lipocalin-like domain-containing protein [Phreatobacter stygius]|uniref:Carotenoid 1,2-hydratase n=1 Tax=Phreatobacter stygius TaxID=1940610 RepID=A0A4D7B0E6_9HYPH|nr:lipocalin-like domain-containing protein [Phreatobacter stygius]QCI63490.1 carotenoid 1,2-hydratase [Phreatobacter stygius]
MTSPNAAQDRAGLLRLASDPEDYRGLGIAPAEVAPFEDGLRIEDAKGTYEWWYFDAHLDDGTKLVVIFYTKPITEPKSRLAPVITINLDLADGRSIEKILHAAPDAFRASKDGCDVWIGDNHFAGDLHRYRITAEIGDVAVDIELVGEIRPWRPKSGHLYFGQPPREHLFAWLPSVPQGHATVTYRIGDAHYRTEGIGYHDHNWGDVPMTDLMHCWYWGRAKVGPYTVIAAYITAAEAYGYASQTVFMLARNGTVIADDDAKVVFTTDRVNADAVTGKPVADITRYEYRDKDERYLITFERAATILQAKFVDRLPLLKRIAARLIGFDGAYLRFTGKLTLQRFVADDLVEAVEEEALWELMYFGHARPPAV